MAQKKQQIPINFDLSQPINHEDLDESITKLLCQQMEEARRERRRGNWKTRSVGRLYPGLELGLPEEGEE